MINILNVKRNYFPKGIRRGLSNFKNKLFSQTSEKQLVKAFSSLGMEEGAVIGIHAMLSGLGYIQNGPGTIIKSVLKAVPDSTLIMPSFPFDGTTDAYLASNPLYNRNTTPSKSGLLSETLRLYPGAKRSYHPTHPCVALGPLADDLINGSEKSKTPFGDRSAYGRYCAMDNAVQLLIQTNSSSIVHRVQEMVNIPNLFLEKTETARGLGPGGIEREYNIHIHTPILPLYWTLPGDEGGSAEYIWSPDYSFLFPEYNRTRILNRLKSQKARGVLLDRHQYFIDNQVYQTTRIDEAEIVAVKVKPWLEKICSDFRENLASFPEFYSQERLNDARQKGFLTK
jgi:aminoglycoside N3'-acetyltransferase